MAQIKAYDNNKLAWTTWASNEANAIISKDPYLIVPGKDVEDVESILRRLFLRILYYENTINNMAMSNVFPVWRHIPGDMDTL